MANKNLNAAKTAKKDEFYTQLTDIERELQHYWPHFRDKVVLCNCDDPYESNFFKYFALRFNQLGLKKLICTCYNGSPVQGNELLLRFEPWDDDDEIKKKAYKVEITEVKDLNGDGAVDLSDVRYLLQNDKNVLSTLQTGDFRDPECIELLKQADIVVTNPPFSLFREYVAQLMKYDKKFVIMGRMSALHYSEIFPLFMHNKMWCGFGFNISVVYKAPYENVLEANRKFVLSKGLNPDDNYIKVPAICWYTNLDISKRHENIDLVCRYSTEKYPTYYNYNAIDVGELADIPCDYVGNMGVPDTILGCYNPDQFELIGLGRDSEEVKVDRSIYEKIKVLNPNARPSHIGFYDKSGKPKEPYSRIIIRNKHPKAL
jgi:hypothetical protein